MIDSTSELRPFQRAAERLLAAGIVAAGPESRQLAEHARESGDDFDALIDRRCAREPLERILGRTRFRTLEMLIGPGAFVPQPETASVVQWTVDALHQMIAAGIAAPRCVDLCTGAGTIALALAAEVPVADVHAVELDAGALSWARRNAERHGLEVTFHHGDIAAALSNLTAAMDLVISNPPYVATHELDGVRPEVRDHDPSVALAAGADGLDLIRIIERVGRRLLRAGGLLVVEHSDRQGMSAPAVFAGNDAWDAISGHRDDDGLDRFVTATRA